MSSIWKKEMRVRNWLKERGVPDRELQDEMIQNFCDMKGLKPYATQWLCERDQRILFAHDNSFKFKLFCLKHYQLITNNIGK